MQLMRTAVAALLLSVLGVTSVVAQDSTRGVRIGLRYDPGTKPGVIVLPISGADGDSIRAIIERDFDFSDRINVIAMSAADAALLEGRAPSGAPVPMNYDLFARLGAAAVIKVTTTTTGLHVAMHDVSRKAVGNVEDYAISGTPNSRDWRHRIHGVADAVEEWMTGQRGIAQSRIAFIRTNVVH